MPLRRTRIACPLCIVCAAGLAACASSRPAPRAATPAPSPGTPAPAERAQADAFDPFAVDATLEHGAHAAAPGGPADRPEAHRAADTEQLFDDALARAVSMGDPAAAPIDGLENLTRVTYAPDGADFDPRVSPDGRSLIYASTQHRPTADIYMKSIASRAVRQLTADPSHDIMPALSPDGQRIAFASDRSGSWDIYVMSAAGGQAVQVTSDGTPELHPSWSPDGTRLVYCRLGSSSGRWELWVSDVNAPSVSEFIGYGLFPEWCPVAGTGERSSDKILFQRSRERGDRAFSIWTIDYTPGDASSPTEIVANAGDAMINPGWSPDGRWVVYATVPAPTQGGTAPRRPTSADLWITAADGSGRVNLTAGRFVNLMPSWGADGRVYFVSDRSGIDNIWSIGTDKALLAATGKPASHETAGVADAENRPH